MLTLRRLLRLPGRHRAGPHLLTPRQIRRELRVQAEVAATHQERREHLRRLSRVEDAPTMIRPPDGWQAALVRPMPARDEVIWG